MDSSCQSLKDRDLGGAQSNTSKTIVIIIVNPVCSTTQHIQTWHCQLNWTIYLRGRSLQCHTLARCVTAHNYLFPTQFWLPSVTLYWLCRCDGCVGGFQPPACYSVKWHATLNWFRSCTKNLLNKLFAHFLKTLKSLPQFVLSRVRQASLLFEIEVLVVKLFHPKHPCHHKWIEGCFIF